MQFEALLLIGLLVAASCLRRGRITEVLWILGFAHLALGSVRHVPLFVSVTAPIIAAEITGLWRSWTMRLSPRSVAGIVEQMGRDLAPGFGRNTIWPLLVITSFAFVGPRMNWPVDFPDINFPTHMVRTQSAMLAGGRLFSFDQWGDYLIFNDPRRKVFIDGRSDFYGSDLGNEYLDAMQAKWTWRKVLDKYGVDKVLSPVAWPLAAVLKQDPGWRLVADDGQAILFARRDRIGTPAAEVPRD
jgi:hypothetical protein